MPLTKHALVFVSDDALLDLTIAECAELLDLARSAKRLGLEVVDPTKADAQSNITEIALQNAQLFRLVTCLAARFGVFHDEMALEIERRARAQESAGGDNATDVAADA